MRRSTATVAVASRAIKAPVIDGKADDAVWATAQVIDGFRTFDPTENGDPRFRTEARVAYDAHNLYVLVRAFDPHPDSIVALLSRRDVRTQSDWLKLIIDGYHDRRTGVELSVNPAGVKRDFAILNDGEEDESWDGVWDVGTRIDSAGLGRRVPRAAESAALRGGERHTFGFGIWRDVARYNERYAWPMYSRSKNGLVVAARRPRRHRRHRVTAAARGVAVLRDARRTTRRRRTATRSAASRRWARTSSTASRRTSRSTRR